MRPRPPWGAIAWSLYLLSLCLPAVITKALLSNHDENDLGIVCLIFGFASVPWFANLALLTAAVANAYKSDRLAVASSVIAIVLALTIFGYPKDDVRPHVGFYVWLASMVATLIASLSPPRVTQAHAVPLAGPDSGVRQ
ncbi:MAG: hypothetical protein QM831_43155 [Kofleriaceae bacterium]